MRKVVFAMFMIMSISPAFSQEKMKKSSDAHSMNPGTHEHEKFYLSLAMGPVFGNIKDHIPGATLTIGGTGFESDFKIGGSISPSLILHATGLSKTIIGPEFSLGGSNVKAPDEVQLTESMWGIGLTHYLNSGHAFSNNLFVSASAGLGAFTLSTVSGGATASITSKSGFGMQLKAGKEWWVSKRWALGVAADYSKTLVKNATSAGTETLSSNRFSIMFNATFD